MKEKINFTLFMHVSNYKSKKLISKRTANLFI